MGEEEEGVAGEAGHGEVEVEMRMITDEVKLVLYDDEDDDEEQLARLE